MPKAGSGRETGPLPKPSYTECKPSSRTRLRRLENSCPANALGVSVDLESGSAPTEGLEVSSVLQQIDAAPKTIEVVELIKIP